MTRKTAERTATTIGTTGFILGYIGIIYGAVIKTPTISIGAALIALATAGAVVYFEFHGEVTHAPQTPSTVPTQAHGRRNVPR